MHIIGHAYFQAELPMTSFYTWKYNFTSVVSSTLPQWK